MNRSVLVFSAYFFSALFVFGQPNDSIVPDSLLNKALHFEQSQEFDSMYAYALRGYEIALTKEEYLIQAECANILAYYLLLTGDYENALKYSKTNHQIRVSSNKQDQNKLIQSKKDLAIVLFVLGQRDSAFLFLNEAIDLGHTMPDISPYVMGKVYSTATSFYEEIEQYYLAQTKGEEFKEYVLKVAPNDSTLLALAYSALGRIALNTEQADEAINYLLEANQYINPTTQVVNSVINYSSLSKAYNYLGNYEDAIRSETKAKELIVQNFGMENPEYAATLLSLGNYYVNNRKYREAIGLLEEADRVLSKTIDETDVRRLETQKAMADCYLKLGEYTRASIFYQNALSSLQTSEEEYASRQLGYTIGLMTSLNHLNKDSLLEILIDSCEQQIATRNNIALSYIVEFYTFRAQLAREKGSFDQAIQFHQKASDQYFVQSHLMTKEALNIEKSISKWNLLRTLREEISTWEMAFNKTQKLQYAIDGYQTFLQAIELTEFLIRNSNRSDQKLRLISQNYDLYEGAMEIVTILYQESSDFIWIKELLKLSERTKALLLLQTWEESSAQLVIPTSLLEEKNEINRKIAVSEFELHQLVRTDSINSQKLNSVKERLFSLKLEQEQWFQKIQKSHPYYFQAKLEKIDFQLSKVQSELTDSEGLVEYMITDSLLYAFFIHQEGVELKIIDLQKTTLIDDIQQLRFNIVHTSTSSTSPLSFEIYQQLLGWIPNIFDLKKLMIIPDGPLCYLPFDLLLYTFPQDHQSNTPYLLRTHTILYNYSARFWMEGKQLSSKYLKAKLLAFAPEINSDRMMSLNVPEATRDALMPLAGAEKEVQTIQQYFKGKSVLGQAATEGRFRQQAKDFSILHLATHGVIDPEQPLYSKLIFSQGTDSSDYDDGLLHTYELLNMQLNAELTTLSACNTGTGTYQKGEGVISLARGFAYAGCPNLVMSLWAVPDQASAQIMTKFYEGLSKGRSKDEALRQAKLWYLDNSPPEKVTPYYWGAWVLIGDDQALQKDFNFWWYIVAGLLLASLFIYRRYFFRFFTYK